MISFDPIINFAVNFANSILATILGGYNTFLQENALLVNIWNLVVTNFFN